MGTMVGVRDELKKVMVGLIALDYDAIAAYEAAIARLKDVEARTALTSFKGDHERHVREMGEQLILIGGQPPDGPDAKRVLTEGKVLVASLVGDSAILRAMKSNVDATNAAYERATTRVDANAELGALLRLNLEDERRHRAWIVERLRMRATHAHT